MQAEFDPRVHAYREDLADKGLEGLVSAARFTEGVVKQVEVGVADIFTSPSETEQRASQALRGETVRVFDEADGWAWGQLESDGYVGYLPQGALSARVHSPTHKVAVPRSFIFTAPDIKSPGAEPISFGERFSVASETEKFAQLKDGRYVYKDHLRTASDVSGDVSGEAVKFVGVPYLWGGRTAFGIDCSGLVQIACLAAGILAPRDSDMQEAYLGEPLDHMDPSRLRAGDLIFWREHIGMMIDDRSMIHANGHHMQTVIEPLDEAISRIAYLYEKPTSFRRLLAD